MRNVIALIIVIFLFLVAILMFINPSSKDQVNQNAFDYSGLDLFLNDKDISVYSSNITDTQKADDFSFRILPLSVFIRKFTSEGRFNFSINANIYDKKLSEMPSLVVMPKWNSSKYFKTLNRDVLIPIDNLNHTIEELYYQSDSYDYIANILRSTKQIFKQSLMLPSGATADVSLFMPQFFDRKNIPEYCDIILNSDEGVLLYQCEEFDNNVYFLSDPDLLNNHGLSQGENASFALMLISYLRSENNNKPIFLDKSTRVFLNEDAIRGEEYERSLSDIKGLLDYPLGIIWGAIFLVAALCFWRGFYRFGLPLSNTMSNVALSKHAAISSFARLLRLSGNDGKLVSQFVQGVLYDKAVAYYGRETNNENGIKRLFKRYERINEPVAKKLEDLAQTLINQSSTMNYHELSRKLDEFEELLRSIEIGTK